MIRSNSPLKIYPWYPDANDVFSTVGISSRFIKFPFRLSIRPPVQRRPMAQSKLNHPQKENYIMLLTIAIILLVLWAIGLLTSYTLGGLIHILIAVAIIMFVVRMIQGRRVV